MWLVSYVHVHLQLHVYMYTCVYLHDYHSMEVSAHCTLLLVGKMLEQRS